MNREELADQMEREVRPLIGVYKGHGGYDCCGCSTYDAILDHCIQIVKGEVDGSRGEEGR